MSNILDNYLNKLKSEVDSEKYEAITNLEEP